MGRLFVKSAYCQKNPRLHAQMSKQENANPISTHTLRESRPEG
jgi:hypothetical protein